MKLNLDKVLNKGVIVSQCCDACPACEYVLAYAEPFLKFWESINSNNSCCVNYFLGQSSYNLVVSTNPFYTNFDSNDNNQYLRHTKCKNNFESCIELLETKVGSVNFQTMLDKGIIERERLFDQNGICFILDYINELGIVDQTEIFNIIDSILTDGLVVNCVGKDLLVVANVETYIKFNETL